MTNSEIRWIDSHCHLPSGEDAKPIINRAVDAGVDVMIVAAEHLQSSQDALALTRANPEHLRAVIGLHPHNASDGFDSLEGFINEAISIRDGMVVGIGECGLDYYYNNSSKSDQKSVFIKQIETAINTDRTLVIHTRDAWEDTFNILREFQELPRTVLHCFTGGPEELEICLELGLYIAFGGITTFPKSTKVQEAAKNCPVDRMLLETDSPYLAPVPFRGKTNEPRNIVAVGEYISKLKGIEIQKFSDAISKNTRKVFNLSGL